MFNSDLENNDKDSKNSRRSFLRNGLLSGTAVLGGIALWGELGTQPVEADTRQETPGVVTIVNFSNDGKKLGKVQMPKVIKTDAEWRQQLPHNSYEIARQADTEMAYTGATWNLHDKGLFRCICCDTALFSSNTKFDSGTGWPSFWAPLAKENIVEKTDSTLGMERTEVKCQLCECAPGTRVRPTAHTQPGCDTA